MFENKNACLDSVYIVWLDIYVGQNYNQEKIMLNFFSLFVQLNKTSQSNNNLYNLLKQFINKNNRTIYKKRHYNFNIKILSK